MEGIFVMMTRQFLTLLILCLPLCLPVASVRAQSVVTLSELQIAFWPEYDRPAMLIIYRGTLSPDTSLPASLKFDIPARYGPPLAVAFTGSNGQLLNLDYTTSASGDTITIAFDAPTPSFQFEYYDTTLDLTYTKSTDVLTASAQGPVVTPDLPPATTGTQTNSPVLVVSAIAGIVGVLLVVGGIVWYTRNRSSTDEPASEPRRRSKPKGQPPRPREVTPKASVEETTSHGPMAAPYCHECGSPIQPDDRFCRNC